MYYILIFIIINKTFVFNLLRKNPNITFRPSVELDDPEGFYIFFESLLLDMMKMGILIPRVDPELREKQENYAVHFFLVIVQKL